METPAFWDEEAGPAFPAFSGERTADACVIGLGGTGLRCLAELAEAGIQAIGVNAGRVAGGAAGHSGGFLLAGLA